MGSSFFLLVVSVSIAASPFVAAESSSWKMKQQIHVADDHLIDVAGRPLGHELLVRLAVERDGARLL